MTAELTYDTHTADLIAYPGPWRFFLPRASIILVSDAELDALSNPDTVLNLGTTDNERNMSLRQVCEDCRKRGAPTLVIAFDHFFRKYRPGQEGQTRKWMPDDDAYIERMAAISRFVESYGLGLELSLLSPLEIGPGYRAKTGESGVWMHYRKGLRDPESGAFSVQLWRQERWANNKGPIDIEDAGVRVFAFRETPVEGTPYRAVDPSEIVEITAVAETECWESAVMRGEDYTARRVRVHGRGGEGAGLDRVLVVQQYRTPEMDYFSEKTLPFLTSLVDRYADAGVKLNGLYSDEMHIQQDWGYFCHHDHGEFAMRYVSPGLQAEFAKLYGEEYGDFAKYLVYFVHGQEDCANDVDAKADAMHVFGSSPEDIRRTTLLRSRYYRLLQDGVVDLFVKAKRHVEKRMGRRLEARAHATWAESPTIDRWEVGQDNQYRHKYEYTSNFVWSCTVHQAAAACHDYFVWGDFLTGNGNDHAEGGWLDRNYYGLALGCSTGILNEIPYSYAGHWGSPIEIRQRRMNLNRAYGVGGPDWFSIVSDMQHRDVEVLMLYPLDLVAADERFGSWMTQYGYANYVTQAKLVERGRVVDGAIEMAGRRFTTLVALFEPLPSRRLLDAMKELVESGGRAVWSGPPPVLSAEGDYVLDLWRDIFGVDYEAEQNEGLLAPGRQVVFEGALEGVSTQTILTDFLVDHTYPCSPRGDAEAVARVKGDVVATLRKTPSGGKAAFLGYRPRDDQAASLGYESRNWFEVLRALGCYATSGRFDGVNDNTESVSRESEYLACRFPNGTVAVAPHFRDLEETWFGGFGRNREDDLAWLAKNPLAPDSISLQEFAVNGHTVTYSGERAVAFRLDDGGRLVAFAGSGSAEITLNGANTAFASRQVDELAWAPVSAERAGRERAVLQIWARGQAAIHFPIGPNTEPTLLVAEGSTPGARGDEVAFRIEDGRLCFELTDELSGRWIYGLVK